MKQVRWCFDSTLETSDELSLQVPQNVCPRHCESCIGVSSNVFSFSEKGRDSHSDNPLYKTNVNASSDYSVRAIVTRVGDEVCGKVLSNGQ